MIRQSVLIQHQLTNRLRRSLWATGELGLEWPGHPKHRFAMTGGGGIPTGLRTSHLNGDGENPRLPLSNPRGRCKVRTEPENHRPRPWRG